MRRRRRRRSPPLLLPSYLLLLPCASVPNYSPRMSRSGAV
jgi:hypothetical protein